MGNFLSAIGQGQQVAGEVQQVIAGADPLIARFKAIAAASAASVLTDKSLTTDEQRIAAASDLCWHNLRGVIGFGVDILRRTDANRLVTQYVAQVIAADELAAGLQALALTSAQAQPAASQMGTVTITSPPAPGVTMFNPPPPAAPESTDAVIVPPAEQDDASAGVSPDAPPQTFDR